MDVGLSASRRGSAKSRRSNTSATAAWASPCTSARARARRARRDLGAAALRETVAKACSIARFTAEDPVRGPAGPGHARAATCPDLDLSHPWDMTPERACEMAIACEAAAHGGGRAHHQFGRRGRQHAPRPARLRQLARLPRARIRARCTASAARCSAREGEQMERDYWYSTARDWRELEDGGQRRPPQRASAPCGASVRASSATMKAPVLFSPDVARGLIGHFIGAIRGGSQYRRSSFLLDAAGQQVFPDWFALSERPHLPKALASAPFDQEGVATRDRELVAGGVLLGYVLEHVFGAQARPEDDRQCRRHPQPRSCTGAAGDFDGDAAQLMDRGLLRHRADGAGRQRRDRRLFARRGRLLGRGRPHRSIRCTRSRSPATSRTSTGASSTSAPTWTCAAAFARARSWSRR